MGHQKQKPARKKISDRIGLSIVVVVFSLVVLFFVFQTAKSINLVLRGKVGRGYCSRVEKSTSSRNGRRKTSYNYFVELRLPDGIVYESKVTPFGSLSRGAAVEVRYDPAFPSLMELNQPYSLGIYPGMFAFAIGSFVWVTGIPIKRIKKKRDRRRETRPRSIPNTLAVQKRKMSLKKRRDRLRRQE